MSSNLFVIVLASSIIKISGIPFSILIHPVNLRTRKNSLSGHFLTCVSETRISITTLNQVIFNTIFYMGAQLVPMFKELKKFYSRECWLL